MAANSVTLVAAKVFSLGLGFLSWLVAARLFAPAEVGLASAVVAAMMLSVQLALVGVGSSVISLLPRAGSRLFALLDSAMTLVVVTAFIVGAVAVLVAGALLERVDVLAAAPIYAVTFLAVTVFGTLGVMFDQTSTVLRRGDHSVVRNIVAGLTILAALPVAHALVGAQWFAILVAWLAGGLAAVTLGLVQLSRSVAGYVPRPRIDPTLARGLLGSGVPNWLLTLTDRTPGYLMPIIVTELLSAETNAYWYVIWMMAWVVFVVPVQVGISLFAEASHRPADLRRVVVHALRIAIGLGLLGAALLAAFANVVLGLMGEQYADQAAGPLRILVVAVIPLAVLQAYYAACRATNRLREATVAAAVAGVVGVLGAALAGVSIGLAGMAGSWVLTQGLVGVWAALRLRHLLRMEPDRVVEGEAVVEPP